MIEFWLIGSIALTGYLVWSSLDKPEAKEIMWRLMVVVFLQLLNILIFSNYLAPMESTSVVSSSGTTYSITDTPNQAFLVSLTQLHTAIFILGGMTLLYKLAATYLFASATLRLRGA